jgi:HK97 gp10 family phage protein
LNEFIQLQGLEAMKRAFAAQPEEIATKVLRKGVFAGASEVKMAAAAYAPFKTGRLRRAAIVKFVRADSNATQVKYIVTFRQGKREQKSDRDAYYARFVEFGHRSRSGSIVPPHRFLKPAFDINYHQALALELLTMRDALAKLPGFSA